MWAVIKPFMQKYGKAKRSDLDKIVGNHISEKQMRRYLDELRAKGLVKTEGKRNYMYYMIGKGEEKGIHQQQKRTDSTKDVANPCVFSWRWRESNPRPNKEPPWFLHAYSAVGFRAAQRSERHRRDLIS